MDYNDDFSPKRLEQEATAMKQQQQQLNDKDDAENHLVGNFQQHHQLSEENANSDWRPMNGMHHDWNSSMFKYRGEQQQHHQFETNNEATNRSAYQHDNNVTSSMSAGQFNKTPTDQQTGHFNDILNSNRQNMEGGCKFKICGNLILPLYIFSSFTNEKAHVKQYF